MGDDEQLSQKAKNAVTDINAIKYISIASFWEIAIKIKLGKLSLSMPYEDLQQQVLLNGFEILPNSFEHTIELMKLDFNHRDLFDRIIIAQALRKNSY